MHNDSSENDDLTEASTRDTSPVREGPGGLSPVQEVPSVASSAPPTPAQNAPHERENSQLEYFPSPLRTSKSCETSTPMRPQMLSALSTDDSPQDTENDRLRKEIVRSLTPRSTKEDTQPRTDSELEAVPRTALSASSSSLPKAQGNTTTPTRGDDSSSDEPARKEEAINANGKLEAAQNVDESNASGHMEKSREQSAESVEAASGRPVLQKKFSWEASSESIGTRSTPGVTATAPIGQFPALHTADSPQSIRAATESLYSEHSLQSKPSDDNITRRVEERPTIIPVARSYEDLQVDLPPRPLPESVAAPSGSSDLDSEQESVTMHASLPDPVDQPSKSAAASDHIQEQSAQSLLEATTAKEISFREILSMSTPQERIRAYISMRHQVASQGSGLANWLQTTGSQYPEHHALLDQNGQMSIQQGDTIYHHKPSPSRSKFPRIGSYYGGGGQQPHTEANHAPKPSFGSPSSGKLTSHQVQEEGKKLLQSAGKIGGKAGGAAKGLFAKGKNKFRASSGGDKVDT